MKTLNTLKRKLTENSEEILIATETTAGIMITLNLVLIPVLFIGAMVLNAMGMPDAWLSNVVQMILIGSIAPGITLLVVNTVKRSWYRQANEVKDAKRLAHFSKSMGV